MTCKRSRSAKKGASSPFLEASFKLDLLNSENSLACIDMPTFEQNILFMLKIQQNTKFIGAKLILIAKTVCLLC